VPRISITVSVTVRAYVLALVVCKVYLEITVIIDSIFAGRVPKGPFWIAGITVRVIVVAVTCTERHSISIIVHIREKVLKAVTVIVLAIADTCCSRISNRIQVITVSGGTAVYTTRTFTEAVSIVVYIQGIAVRIRIYKINQSVTVIVQPITAGRGTKGSFHPRRQRGTGVLQGPCITDKLACCYTFSCTTVRRCGHIFIIRGA